MSAQNEHGQGVSHAIDNSKVPGKVQEAAPVGLERKLPEKVRIPCYSFPIQFLQTFQVHPTGAVNTGTKVSHAKGGGEASIVPQKLQEKLPEKIERVVPNAIHDTGDEGGLHRKQH